MLRKTDTGNHSQACSKVESSYQVFLDPDTTLATTEKLIGGTSHMYRSDVSQLHDLRGSFDNQVY